MTEPRTIHPAQGRLLDAALEQVFAGSAVAGQPRHSWLAAAVVLLGVTITAVTMWLVSAADRTAAQEPATLAPPVSAEGRTALEALPADTTNLIAYVLRPTDIVVFERFRSLRKLVLMPLDVRLGPINTRRKLPAWNSPPADLLAPLAGLPTLDCLQISSQIAVTPTVLAPLAASRSLREMQFAGEHVHVDAAFVAALAAIQSLRALRFDLVRLDATALDGLRGLHLESLAIERPDGFDAGAWQVLCKTSSLRELTLSWFGRDHFSHVAGYWMPEPDDLRALARLPRLRRIELMQCAATDEHLTSLPDSLTGLALRNVDLSPVGWRSLKRFATLRDLHVRTQRQTVNAFADEPSELRQACADAVADAISVLRLHSLQFEGELTPDLARAIAAQPDLVDLRVTWHRIGDLSGLAGAPALRRVVLCELRSPGLVTLESLAPLRDCPRLASLELLVHSGLDEAEVQELLGDKVAVKLRSW